MKSVAHIILAALLAGGTAALANEGGQKDSKQQKTAINFEQHDLNSDGMLSQDEWTDARISFEELDQNQDRMLDRQELQSAGLKLEDSGESMSLTGSEDQQASQMQQDTQMQDTQVQQVETEGGVANDFDYYDTNADGRLDENEAQTDAYLEANFESWDANNDGYLEEDEFGETELQYEQDY